MSRDTRSASVRHRPLADHLPAHVRRRLTVHRTARGQQWDGVVALLGNDDRDAGRTTGGPLQLVPRRTRRTDDRDLERPGRHRLRRGQRPAGEPRRLHRQGGDGGQRLVGGLAVAPLARQRGRRQQGVHHRRQAGRAGVVRRVARPGDQRLGVGGGVVEAAVVRAEAVEGVVEHRPRSLQPHRLAGRARQGQEARAPRSRGPRARRGAGRPRRRGRPAAASRPPAGAARPAACRRAARRRRRSSRPSRRPASTREAMARPFQAATTLSSRAGRTRSSRAASSRRRTSDQRPASSGSASSWSVDEPCSNVPAVGHLEQPCRPARRPPRRAPRRSCAGVQT